MHVRFPPSLHDHGRLGRRPCGHRRPELACPEPCREFLSAPRAWEVDCISAVRSPLMSLVNWSPTSHHCISNTKRVHFVGGIRPGVGRQDVDTVSTGRLWARSLSDTALGSNAAMRPHDHPAPMELTMGDARQSPHDSCVDLLARTRVRRLSARPSDESRERPSTDSAATSSARHLGTC